MRVKGQRVRELREATGLSREQFAVKAGTTGRTLARIELDEGPSNLGTLKLIANALECDVDDFLDEEQVAA